MAEFHFAASVSESWHRDTLSHCHDLLVLSSVQLAGLFVFIFKFKEYWAVECQWAVSKPSRDSQPDVMD